MALHAVVKRQMEAEQAAAVFAQQQEREAVTAARAQQQQKETAEAVADKQRQREADEAAAAAAAAALAMQQQKEAQEAAAAKQRQREADEAAAAAASLAMQQQQPQQQQAFHLPPLLPPPAQLFCYFSLLPANKNRAPSLSCCCSAVLQLANPQLFLRSKGVCAAALSNSLRWRSASASSGEVAQRELAFPRP